ncbi:MAG: PIG-L deacetylase family protein [Flavobacteriaceae bacterium]|tara:strand:- start:10756 stop:11472 length:717 start_codon:yes stop_codon:yes gene_type:complete
MLEYLKNKRILVVVAHPDDEVIGIGGSIYSLVNRHGCRVRCVILGEGITSRDEIRDLQSSKDKLSIHKKNILEAKKIIGYQELSTYQFPDNRFDEISLLDLIKTVEKEKEIFQPDIILTHHGGDLNIDHQKTFEATITACRPLEKEHVEAIITFETYSGTEWQASSDPRRFIPNLYFSLSQEDINQKIKAMGCYEFEKRSFPHPRSSKALKLVAERYGVLVGNYYAEPFSLIRMISKL